MGVGGQWGLLEAEGAEEGLSDSSDWGAGLLVTVGALCRAPTACRHCSKHLGCELVSVLLWGSILLQMRKPSSRDV